METVKARKQGNAVMVTLASKFGVQEGQEFYIFKEEDDALTLIPKINDYFANAKAGEFIDDELDELVREFTPRGHELDEY